jgi:putative ABC transport system permease protein
MFGAGLMFRTIARIARTDVGFRTDGVITATLVLPATSYPDSAARRLGLERILERLARTDGVRSAAAVFPQPFWGTGGFPVFSEGGAVDPAAVPRAGVYTVSPDYFRSMDVPLRAGRVLRAADDHAAPLVVVVSERLAARIAPRGTALGRRIRVRVPHLASWDDVDDQSWRTIVGIVGDTKKSFESALPEEPDLYVPYAQNPRAWQAIVVHTDRAEELMFEPVKRAVGSVDRTIALSQVSSVASLAAEQVGQRSALLVLLGVFAAFALGLSALALYASLSFTVMQRRLELAVRRAVGARARSIALLVAHEGLGSVLLGVAVGVAASLALGGVLRNQLYGVGATDPATLVAISLVLSLTALAACIVPCLRALRTDPALALREQ